MFKSLFTKSFITQTLMPSVAQITLLVLLLPFIAVVIKWIMPEQAGDFIKNTLDEIPIINVLAEYYSAISSSGDLKPFYLFTYIIEAITSTIMSTYIIGLCVYIFKLIGELIGIRGIAAIQTVIGIFASCFVIKLIGEDIESNIICLAVLTIIALVITLVARRGNIMRFLVEGGIGVGMSVITSATVSAYCVSLVALTKGDFESLSEGVLIVLLSLIPAVICLLIDYLLFGRKI